MKRQPTFGDMPTAVDNIQKKVDSLPETVENIQKTVNRIERMLMSSAFFVTSQLTREAPQQKHPPAQTLRPNISPNQIRKLHESLKYVFGVLLIKYILLSLQPKKL